MLRCLGKYETVLVLVEVHKGTCNRHIGGKALTHILLMAVYYFPPLMKYRITLSRGAINVSDMLTFTMPQPNFTSR